MLHVVEALSRERAVVGQSPQNLLPNVHPLGGHLPPAVIHARAARLRQLGEKHRSEFARGFIGHQLRVLVEETPTADGARLGYSRNYQRVSIAAPVAANREVTVYVRAAQGARLIGEPVATQVNA